MSAVQREPAVDAPGHGHGPHVAPVRHAGVAVVEQGLRAAARARDADGEQRLGLTVPWVHDSDEIAAHPAHVLGGHS